MLCFLVIFNFCKVHIFSPLVQPWYCIWDAGNKSGFLTNTGGIERVKEQYSLIFIQFSNNLVTVFVDCLMYCFCFSPRFGGLSRQILSPHSTWYWRQTGHRWTTRKVFSTQETYSHLVSALVKSLWLHDNMSCSSSHKGHVAAVVIHSAWHYQTQNKRVNNIIAICLRFQVNHIKPYKSCYSTPETIKRLYFILNSHLFTIHCTEMLLFCFSSQLYKTNIMFTLHEMKHTQIANIIIIMTNYNCNLCILHFM